jgi:small subunit ribosomal protein S20
VVRTSGFHPGNRGSIPLWTTNSSKNVFRLLICRKIKIMANHKSSEKRIRQIEVKKENNKYYAKTMRNALKEFRGTTDKKEAEAMKPKVESMLDRLSKKNVIHKKKASNLKSSLANHVSKL